MKVCFSRILARGNLELGQISINQPLIPNTSEWEDASLGVGYTYPSAPHLMEWGWTCLKIPWSMKMEDDPQWTP